MGSPPGGPMSTTSWPRCSNSSRTASVSASFSSDPSASFIAFQRTGQRARQAALDRREFLRRTAQLGGAVALGGPALAANARVALAADDFGSMLDDPAKESPIDTVVVVMMENRSFDHYFGWLADDKKYVERGKSRYGKRFRINGKQVQSFPAPEGKNDQAG